jgi:ABC-type bacteriocin/lantibiotic exporter with double-glycine peptidase domain
VIKLCSLVSAIKVLCQIAQIHDHIESLPDKYNSLCGQRGSSLSGGQQQRLVIARALLRQPELLLLDEATSALDVETEDALVSALERWKDETGSALVVITHRIRTIKHCDAAIVLHHGMVSVWFVAETDITLINALLFQVKEFGAKDDLIAKQGDFYNQCIASI